MQMSCPGSGIAAGDLAKLAWAFGALHGPSGAWRKRMDSGQTSQESA